MAKKNENRVLVTLVCDECKEQNYTVSKNKKNTTERLELNKYCPRCRKNTTESGLVNILDEMMQHVNKYKYRATQK